LNRSTGAELGSLLVPANLYGQRTSATITATDRDLALFVPGCCGVGVELYDPATLVHRTSVVTQDANAVAWSGAYLLIGHEAGTVELWSVNGATTTLLQDINLRTLTGHTGIEDIEIRAVWTDGVDRFRVRRVELGQRPVARSDIAIVLRARTIRRLRRSSGFDLGHRAVHAQHVPLTP